MSTPLRRTAAVLAGATLTVGLLAACGDDEPAPTAGDPTTTGTTTGPTDATDTTDAPSASGSGTPESPDPKVIPVYYVGDAPRGDVLFREFSQASGVDPLFAAAAAVTAGDPIDPDYRTLWPGGRFAGVEQTSDAIVVDVADKAWLQRGRLDRTQARLAIQQLVYTLQGVAGERLPVRVTLDGAPAATLLGVPVRTGFTAAPELDVLALVNITEPAEGSAVSRTFTATGRASSFEATVPWVLENAAGKVVLRGFSNAEGWIDKLYPWETSVDVSALKPGRYTFVARTDDPSNGEGGGPTEDTKRITIE